MKERPILFSSEMVRAILEGRKAQTRRIVNPQPPYREDTFWNSQDDKTLWFGVDEKTKTRGKYFKCPYGCTGDRLWVREKFSYLEYMPVPFSIPEPAIWYWASGEPTHGDWTPPKPSIHMPRFASRITLEITDIRVEHVQDISLDDSEAEGIDLEGAHELDFAEAEHAQIGGLSLPCSMAELWPFVKLWDSINAKRGFGWYANPWVWVIEFKRVEPSK